VHAILSRGTILKSVNPLPVESSYNDGNSLQPEVAVKRHSRGAFAILACVLISSLGAEERLNSVHFGIPQDWTQHHLLFSRDGLVQRPDLIYSEPRVLHQAVQRWQSVRPQMPGAESTVASSSTPQRDWSVALGTGRDVLNMYPAKFSLDAGAPPSCVSDYVVFGLNVVGTTGGQSNLVAFNNLYAGAGGLCGAAPNVMFAYNVTTAGAGKVRTSPVLSLDGTKIAFVESSGASVFHVLTWSTGAGNGGITAAALPGVGNAASMTSTRYSSVTNTRSSPWVDYNTDNAYMGADDGKVYKFTGVFKGTPTLVTTAPWPVSVSPGSVLTAPVLDKNLGLLMVGNSNGTLFSIDTTTGAVKSLVIGNGATNPGIMGPPIVDITNGTTFAVSANDGTSGVLVEVDTATMTELARARIGLASASGTAINLFQPAFSNDYFNSPSTGVARLCGTGAADVTPSQYAFGFTGRTMNTTPVFSQQLLPSTKATCSGWTEFFNPNVNGGTDFFFFGLTFDCNGKNTPGCVVARTSDVSLTTASVAGGPSGIVVDNFSTAGQASSIYFTGARGPNTAFKFTQNGLQ
jgi:hypothetical protein